MLTTSPINFAQLIMQISHDLTFRAIRTSLPTPNTHSTSHLDVFAPIYIPSKRNSKLNNHQHQIYIFCVSRKSLYSRSTAQTDNPHHHHRLPDNWLIPFARLRSIYTITQMIYTHLFAQRHPTAQRRRQSNHFGDQRLEREILLERDAPQNGFHLGNAGTWNTEHGAKRQPQNGFGRALRSIRGFEGRGVGSVSGCGGWSGLIGVRGRTNKKTTTAYMVQMIRTMRQDIRGERERSDCIRTPDQTRSRRK